MAEQDGQVLVWDPNERSPDGSLGAWTNKFGGGYQPVGDWTSLGVAQPTTIVEALDIIQAFLSSTGMEMRLPRGLPQKSL